MTILEAADLERLTNEWQSRGGPETGLVPRPPRTPPSQGRENELRSPGVNVETGPVARPPRTPPSQGRENGGGSPVFHPPLTKGGQGGFSQVDAMRALRAPVGHEAYVASRFDALHGRFKLEVAEDDPRLMAILESLGPSRGRQVLDLGCGKGRFARFLAARGARVVGLDISPAMLAAGGGAGLDRVIGSARRLPFRDASFDAAIAVEVFEHMEPRAIDDACDELRRVLRPGGRFVLIDKNLYAMNTRRPWLPAVAVKWLDQRRGLWMYLAGGPVRERWFRPVEMTRRLARWFPEVRMRHLLSRDEAGRFPFRSVPATRLFVLWAARSPGGSA
jgi:SAM-dependent methyltransferase